MSVSVITWYVIIGFLPSIFVVSFSPSRENAGDSNNSHVTYISFKTLSNAVSSFDVI